jgi:diacylglycerol diphosphate phosphatase / phosphatidate phosphatase
MTFASMFLAGQLKLYDGQGYVLKFLIAAFPVCLAGFVALTRVIEYRHHWDDGNANSKQLKVDFVVLAGSILGIFVAIICYCLYFPFPTTEGSELPRSTRFDKIERKHVKEEPRPIENNVVI